MPLDASGNWADSFIDIFRDRRRRVAAQPDIDQQRMLRDTQQQQLRTEMARQQQEDSANDAAASALGQWQPAPVQPAQPVEPPVLSRAPSAANGGYPPGFKIQQRIKARGQEGMDAVGSALEEEAVKKAVTRPDFPALAASGQIPQHLLEPLLRAPKYREFAMKSIENRMSAPLDAYKLGEDYRQREHTMRNQDATLAETRRGHTLTQQQRGDTLAEAKAKRTWEEGPIKHQRDMEIEGVKVTGRKDVAGINAGARKYSDDVRAGSAKAKIGQAEAVLKQKESQFTRGIQALQAENDTKRRQEISVKVFELKGQIERDHNALNKMRESYTYSLQGADAGAALAQEGGPVVTNPGLFSDSQQPIAPRGLMPPIPQPASVLQDQARAQVATMTPAQKAELKAQLRAQRGK